MQPFPLVEAGVQLGGFEIIRETECIHDPELDALVGSRGGSRRLHLGAEGRSDLSSESRHVAEALDMLSLGLEFKGGSRMYLNANK